MAEREYVVVPGTLKGLGSKGYIAKPLPTVEELAEVMAATTSEYRWCDMSDGERAACFNVAAAVPCAA